MSLSYFTLSIIYIFKIKFYILIKKLQVLDVKIHSLRRMFNFFYKKLLTKKEICMIEFLNYLNSINLAFHCCMKCITNSYISSLAWNLYKIVIINYLLYDCILIYLVYVYFQIGDHNSLLKKKGLYWNLMNQQASDKAKAA